VVSPLSSLPASEQVALGDVISNDWDATENGLIFSKEPEAVVTVKPASDIAGEVGLRGRRVFACPQHQPSDRTRQRDHRYPT
jgi:hypothetical protein